MASKRPVNERAPLGRAIIASTAADLIAEEGVEKLTMRGLATRLDVSAMALYHHVEDKDELLRMVGDDILGRIELPDPDSGDWRELLTSVVHETQDRLLSVPGLGKAMLTGKISPNARKYVSFCIHQFERAGFGHVAAQEAYAGIHQLVLGRMMVVDSANFQLHATPHPDDEVRDYIKRLHSPSTFDRALSALLDQYPPPPRSRGGSRRGDGRVRSRPNRR